ncbi:MAG: glycosyltransferase family 4 protein [Acidimicrobiales bacterium]
MKLAYVLPVPPTGDGPAARAAAWPHNQRLLQLLADRHGIEAHAVWPSTVEATATIGAVTHHTTASVARVVRALGPDVVHLNGLVFPRLAWALRRAAGRGARVVAQHHGELVPVGARRRLVACRTQRSVVDRFLFCGLPGQADPWRAARVLGPRTPVAEVLEASTDLVAERAAAAPVGPTGGGERDGHPDGGPDVLWVGRWHADKDVATVLDGFTRFTRQRPGARLWLAGGEGPPPFDLPDRVRTLGRLAQVELAGWYAACPLLVSASRHEGSGYAVIEAMANGCLPVLSDLPSHRAIAAEVAEHFPVGDAAALADALGRAAGRAAEPGCRASVRARFDAALTWEAVADQLVAAYR